jgi:hypothetical protein
VSQQPAVNCPLLVLLQSQTPSSHYEQSLIKKLRVKPAANMANNKLTSLNQSAGNNKKTPELG